MDERLDAILTACEDVWRQAAVEGWHQGRMSGDKFISWGGERGQEQVGSCAVLATNITTALDGAWFTDWSCPFCEWHGLRAGSAARHLNDKHGWRWLDFANKFRDALAQGMTT